jgi:hypothetical protein
MINAGDTRTASSTSSRLSIGTVSRPPSTRLNLC